MIHIGRLYFWFYWPFSQPAKWGLTRYAHDPKAPSYDMRIEWMLFFGWFAIVWYDKRSPR